MCVIDITFMQRQPDKYIKYIKNAEKEETKKITKEETKKNSIVHNLHSFEEREYLLSPLFMYRKETERHYEQRNKQTNKPTQN